jgi:hypothetical protein
MKEFFVGILIIVLVYFGLDYYSKTGSVKPVALNVAISQCIQTLDANKCNIDEIKNKIKESSAIAISKPALWSVNNELIDMSNGNAIALNTAGLGYHQLVVWNSYLNDGKRKQGNYFMNENSAMGIGILIVLFIGGLLVIFAIIPFIWKFFLNRVSEVSKAVKGEKVD